MKKIFGLFSLLFILNGCAESMALLAPASTAMSGGNIVHSSATSLASFSIKKSTGKSPAEHAISLAKKHNPDRKKEKCVEFLESTNSEVCKILKTRVTKLKTKINERSHIKNFVGN
mgnify:FL=1|jgi:hypothetical protein